MCNLDRNLQYRDVQTYTYMSDWCCSGFGVNCIPSHEMDHKYCIVPNILLRYLFKCLWLRLPIVNYKNAWYFIILLKYFWQKFVKCDTELGLKVCDPSGNWELFVKCCLSERSVSHFTRDETECRIVKTKNVFMWFLWAYTSIITIIIIITNFSWSVPW